MFIIKSTGSLVRCIFLHPPYDSFYAFELKHIYRKLCHIPLECVGSELVWVSQAMSHQLLTVVVMLIQEVKQQIGFHLAHLRGAA